MAITQKQRDTKETPPTTVFAGSNPTTTTSKCIDGPKQMGVFEGGQVWLLPSLMRDDIVIAQVHFDPCARTNWHKHEGGQLLRVVAGSGWVCDQGGEPRRINAGDTVWSPPGCIHWHGADDGSFMVHEATSFGALEWYDPVTEEEYSDKTKNGGEAQSTS